MPLDEQETSPFSETSIKSTSPEREELSHEMPADERPLWLPRPSEGDLDDPAWPAVLPAATPR